MSGKRVLCLGEALIDAVHCGGTTVEHVGGSLLNVATGLAQLGHRVSIGAWWAPDERGQRLASAAADAGVLVEPGTDGASRTTVAFADIQDEGKATYTFDIEWALPQLSNLDQVTHLHTGSIAATLEPGGTQVLETVRAVRPTGTISYDPNVRPALMGSPEEVLQRVEELVCLSDVVKASDEDLGWLFPDQPVEEVMRRWLTLGPLMMVVTRGPWGAYARLRNDPDLLVIDPVTATVADTVGAGDSFMAGLISGLLTADLLGTVEARERLAACRWPDVQPALHRALTTASLTVRRAGAYAPTLDEVESTRVKDSRFTQ